MVRALCNVEAKVGGMSSATYCNCKLHVSNFFFLLYTTLCLRDFSRTISPQSIGLKPFREIIKRFDYVNEYG